mgnify:CR=1 FL=1
MNKIVVAIDSFKGSLSSREAAEAAEQGIKTIYYIRNQSLEMDECTSCSS